MKKSFITLGSDGELRPKPDKIIVILHSLLQILNDTKYYVVSNSIKTLF